jgi:hypothetical protein
MRLPGRFVKGDHELVEKALAAQEKRHVCPGKAHRYGEAQADFSDQNLDVVNTSLNGTYLAPGDTSQDTWLTVSPSLTE